MTGFIFTVLAIGLVLAALVAIIAFWRSLRSARALNQRCIAELAQLKSLITSRHLILSHLSDSVPASLDGAFDRKRMDRRRQRAEQAIQEIDPLDPDSSHIRAFSDIEQRLLELVEDLCRVLEESDASLTSPSVAACLEGLEKVDAEILDAMSTYNASAITFTGFLDASLIARKYYHCNYALLDLDPQGSCVSTSRFASPS